MTTSTGLSDKAMAVFAFAAYHQLESGQAVTKVILRDGSGHQADPDAVQELESRGLITVEGNDIVFSPGAQTLLGDLIEAMRQKLA